MRLFGGHGVDVLTKKVSLNSSGLGDLHLVMREEGLALPHLPPSQSFHAISALNVNLGLAMVVQGKAAEGYHMHESQTRSNKNEGPTSRNLLLVLMLSRPCAKTTQENK